MHVHQIGGIFPDESGSRSPLRASASIRKGRNSTDSRRPPRLTIPRQSSFRPPADLDRIDSVPPSRHVDLTLGALPPQSERLKASDVSKLCQGEWQKRYLVLTNETLFMTLPDSEEISDKIPLCEVKNVTKILDNTRDILSGRDEDKIFNVHTTPDGYNCGREYCFLVETDEEVDEWLQKLLLYSKQAAKRAANRTRLEKYRARAQRITKSNLWQRVNGFLVAANLVVNIAQSQALPNQGSTNMAIFDALDITFTSVFCVELALHLFAYWFLPFFQDGWLVFDFFVVTVSVASLLLKNLPGVSVLRLLRTFRVLRLFNRLRSLRTLINALAASLLPVLNAFIMVILVCVVYAILGVELFHERNPTLFGSFALSYWTMFEVSTFDGWAEKARKLSDTVELDVDPVVAIFMCTFIGVIAVLLDNFIRAVGVEKVKAQREKDEAEMKALGVSRADVGNPLDPLLLILSRFRNSEELSRRIGTLFNVLDADRGGSISFQELHEGLRKMEQLEPRIHISSEDFLRMVRVAASTHTHDDEADGGQAKRSAPLPGLAPAAQVAAANHSSGAAAAPAATAASASSAGTASAATAATSSSFGRAPTGASMAGTSLVSASAGRGLFGRAPTGGSVTGDNFGSALTTGSSVGGAGVQPGYSSKFLSVDDIATATALDVEGESLGAEDFDRVMRAEVRSYVDGCVAQAYEEALLSGDRGGGDRGGGGVGGSAALAALKVLLMRDEERGEHAAVMRELRGLRNEVRAARAEMRELGRCNARGASGAAATVGVAVNGGYASVHSVPAATEAEQWEAGSFGVSIGGKGAPRLGTNGTSRVVPNGSRLSSRAESFNSTSSSTAAPSQRAGVAFADSFMSEYLGYQNNSDSDDLGSSRPPPAPPPLNKGSRGMPVEADVCAQPLPLPSPSLSAVLQPLLPVLQRRASAGAAVDDLSGRGSVMLRPKSSMKSALRRPRSCGAQNAQTPDVLRSDAGARTSNEVAADATSSRVDEFQRRWSLPGSPPADAPPAWGGIGHTADDEWASSELRLPPTSGAWTRPSPHGPLGKEEDREEFGSWPGEDGTGKVSEAAWIAATTEAFQASQGLSSVMPRVVNGSSDVAAAEDKLWNTRGERARSAPLAPAAPVDGSSGPASVGFELEDRPPSPKWQPIAENTSLPAGRLQSPVPMLAEAAPPAMLFGLPVQSGGDSYTPRSESGSSPPPPPPPRPPLPQSWIVDPVDPVRTKDGYASNSGVRQWTIPNLTAFGSGRGLQMTSVSGDGNPIVATADVVLGQRDGGQVLLL